MDRNSGNPTSTPHLILAGGSESHLQILQGYIQMTQKDICLDGAYRSGEELLRTLQKNRTVDVIFMDYFLCDTTVPNLLRRLKKCSLPTHPKILCAVESQSDLESDAFSSLGVDCYMIKPYSMEQLFEKTRELCGSGWQAWKNALKKVILDCGISDNRALYAYIYHALICVLTSTQECLQANEIYHEVALKETVMESTVETSLRRAAALACECGTERYRQICNEAGEATDKPLGNGRFLKLLAQDVRRYMKDSCTETTMV